VAPLTVPAPGASTGGADDAAGALASPYASRAAIPVLSASEQKTVGELRVHQGATSHVVKSVHRTAHVTYDPETGTFSDVPPEWREELSKLFGLPLALCASKAVRGYSGRVPAVLLHLKDSLLAHGGLQAKGVFRIAPEGADAAAAKAQLNDCRGRFPPCTDVHIAANLLKVWFRDLPSRLLDVIPDSREIVDCESAAAAGATVLRHYRDPQLTLLLWLLDLCADVASCAGENLMTAQNMAIVFAPNLFKLADAAHAPPGMDPMAQMALCKKYTTFLKLAIEWRATDPARPTGKFVPAD
jgi:hypothetical protein